MIFALQSGMMAFQHFPNHLDSSTNRPKFLIKNAHNYTSTTAAEAAIEDIRKGYRVQIIMRGLPGSGKSFLAKNIVAEGLGIHLNCTLPYIFSSDDYFMQAGWYAYDVTKLSDAHAWNKQEVLKVLSKGVSPVVVDNTNTESWEMLDYIKMASSNGYRVRIIEPKTKWSFNCAELAKRNTHNVPFQKIKRMSQRYDKNVNLMRLLSMASATIKYQSEPLMRFLPPLKSPDSENRSSNHNYMNGDLKLPGKKLCGDRRNNNSLGKSEVSMNIEISDDENSNGARRKITSLSAEQSNAVETTNLIEISDDSNESSTNSAWPNAGILQPVKVKNASNVMECLSNYEQTWGVDSNILRSWNIVSPLKPVEPTIVDVNIAKSSTNEKVFVDQSTNTELSDFHLVNNNCPDNLKILNTTYRDINVGMKLALNRPGFLDKGCSTQDEFCSDRYADLKSLTEIFKNIPPLYIRDMYDNCKGDFDMTVEIFLEDNKDYSHISFTTENILCDEEDAKRNKESKQVEEIEYITTTKRSWDNSDSEDTDDVKEVVIEKTTPDDQKPCCSTWNEPKPTDAKEELVIIDSDTEDRSSSVSSERSVEDTMELNMGYAFIEQLEEKFGDTNHSYPRGFQPVVQLPKSLARQLYAFYIESVYQQMEAQDAIMQKLEKEDEAFARRLLEEQNLEGQETNKTPNFREIMHEQAAISIYEREVEAIKKEMTPNDLSSLLTRKKLFNTFPMVDQSVINELLLSNEGNYKQTVEDLIGSVGNGVGNDVKNPPMSEDLLDEIKKDHESCAIEEKKTSQTSQDYRDEAKACLDRRRELQQKAQLHHGRGEHEVAQFYIELAAKQTRLCHRANEFAATQLLEENSNRLCNFDTLDLHYLYVAEALQALDVFIDRNINLLRDENGSKKTQNLFVITGRGKRSKNNKSKIKPAVTRKLIQREIKFVELNPGLLKIKVTSNTKTT